jgi:hypothetical protein
MKTHKRDYACLAILADAETAMRLLLGWFGDYKTIQPRSGLRMLAPRVPQPECLNPPRRLPGQIGCIPAGQPSLVDDLKPI